jgi:NAD(P)-dependent dehydrogenase (short-subunit alcohol dehydrogenase family)
MNEAIFICGVSRGIGLELASLFCADGDTVYGIARSPQPERPVEGLVYRSLAAETFSLASFPELNSRTFDKIILNSAVLGPPAQFSLDYPADKLKSLFDTNVIAHYRALQELRPRIKTDGTAQVVFTVSRGGVQSTIRGRVGIGYRSTKAAQIALALALVYPLSELGISVYLINPGSVATKIGGPKARLTAAESASNIKATLSRAARYPSGTIFDYDGKVMEIHIKGAGKPAAEPIADQSVQVKAAAKPN